MGRLRGPKRGQRDPRERQEGPKRSPKEVRKTKNGEGKNVEKPLVFIGFLRFQSQLEANLRHLEANLRHLGANMMPT